MNFEKIEQAYELLLDNCQRLENELKTHIYDALIEQNAYYLGAEGAPEAVATNNKQLHALHLTAKEWRRVFQFLFIKANQTEQLQMNHQFTPDSIGFLMTFLIDQLAVAPQVDLLEIGSGTGNLAFTILQQSTKAITYLGIELDDLLIDLAASIAEVMACPVDFVQEDAVRPQILKESDVIISDLPIGYYPNDQIAKRYQVASPDEHTYAHHLLMEQSLKYLKADGFAIFLVPADLLTSPQSPLLKKWLKNDAEIRALITLPANIFGDKAMQKAIIILQKSRFVTGQTFVYPINDLSSPENIRDFMTKFKKWQADSVTK
ncbi:class I SAM-dependent methyltransferase [Streptococcus halichoeri]|uniref:class I SAM-dependent methyltransferase n=1 Tax=Streptococcus halichoeri TaxID=254785 RepID=UPI0013583DD8|nr:class I SAM-dependent methyltransferase [Streptococcus halichoeri]